MEYIENRSEMLQDAADKENDQELWRLLDKYNMTEYSTMVYKSIKYNQRNHEVLATKASITRRFWYPGNDGKRYTTNYTYTER